MYNIKKALVIPSYKVAKTLKDVLLSIPETFDYIIVVDDKCLDYSGKEAETLNKENLIIIYHEQNQGVGGSVITGYKKALELGCDIVIKMDGDGQMDPRYIDNLIFPILENKADYTKGNRYKDFKSLKSMPTIRFFGNSVLSFLLKIASGYWDIMDPTNGYTAIHRRILEKLNLDKISKRYFFESDMLVNLNIMSAVVKDVYIPAQYGDERSSLSIKKVLFQFPPKILKRFIKRIFYKYFIYDFNMASIYILLGFPMFIISILLGITEWLDSAKTGIPKPTGTIILLASSFIISLQMLLQAIHIDINSNPNKSV